MLKLELDKMQKAIERAKREHLKVRIINAGNREYAVGPYTVRFAVANGVRLGECNCKGAQAGYYCKHLAAGAQANIMCQSVRELNPTPAESQAFISRNVGWMV
jgi:SWIM zinc finger